MVRSFVIGVVVGVTVMVPGVHPAAAAPGAKRDNTGTVAGMVERRRADGSLAPAPEVVVYLDESPLLPADGQGQVRAVVQTEQRFEPSLTVIPRGGAVKFPNRDLVAHKVFSLSETQPFDLALNRGGPGEPVTFADPGVVDVYCNIHPHMKATIIVVPNSFYTIAGADGRFVIEHVPVGRHTLVVWSHGEVRTRVEVRAGRTAQVHLVLDAVSTKPPAKDGASFHRHF